MAVIELFLQGEGIPQITLVTVPESGTAHDIIEAARRHGLRHTGTEPFVWIEGEEEPLDLTVSLTALGIGQRRRVHVHTHHRVEVTVNFNGQQKAHAFSPATTVAAVKVWADEKFHLTGVDATEHTLQRCGSSERPTDDIHIGALLASGARELCFDLVPKQRVEG